MEALFVVVFVNGSIFFWGFYGGLLCFAEIIMMTMTYIYIF